MTHVNHVASVDDIAVERLKAAGAIVIGKTNVGELGFGAVAHNALFPETRNPWDTNRTATGASAGSAAAVAAGMGSISIACDSGGSVRGPASMVGVFGYKPSFGRIPLYPAARDPATSGAWSRASLEHVCPVTRCVEDAALLMEVLSGPDMRDRHSIPCADVDWMACRPSRTGFRIAYTSDFGFAPVDSEIRLRTELAAQMLAEKMGVELTVAAPDLKGMSGAFWGSVVRDADIAGLRQMAFGGQLYMPGLREAAANPWSDEALSMAAKLRMEVSNRIAAFMGDFDLLLCPATSTTAYGLGQFGPRTVEGQPAPSNGDSLPALWPANLTGQPAASVPIGLDSNGLPIGLHVMGRELQDGDVLQASRVMQRLVEWPQVWSNSL